jgi:hypothetical protein
MPERLDRVAITTTRATIELPWGSRDRLLHEIRNLDGADKIRTAFEAVGASQPVPLSRDDQLILYKAIDGWANSVTVDELPDGIWNLRCALADEFRDKPDTAA